MLLPHIIDAAAGALGGATLATALAAVLEPDIGFGGLLSTGAAGAVIVAIIVLTRAHAEQNKLAAQTMDATAKTSQAIAEKFAETTQTMAREAREAHETCTSLIIEFVSKAKQ